MEARQEALRIWRANGTPDEIAQEINSTAILLREMRQPERAAELTREAYDLRLGSRGVDSPRTIELLGNLALCEAESGRLAVADSVYREALAAFERIQDRTIFHTFARMGYANVCRDLGRYAEADSMYARTEAELDSTRTGHSVYFGECLFQHGVLRARQGDAVEAERMMARGFDLRRAGQPETSPGLGGPFPARLPAAISLGRGTSSGPADHHPASSPYSQARANAQSRSTVRVDVPSVSAVSSTSRPP